MKIDNIFTFHGNVELPTNLTVIDSIYLHSEVILGFNKRGCDTIFVSNKNKFLYGTNSNGTNWRCDSVFHK